MEENRLSSISKADPDEKTGEFWDSHDFTELDTNAPIYLWIFQIKRTRIKNVY
jgi:hypothetical protein